ncbi:MAG: PmoA family protein [Planctomycetaceae bacterium]|nr:PmoA family protein [Planctomycetaceae bacterium]
MTRKDLLAAMARFWLLVLIGCWFGLHSPVNRVVCGNELGCHDLAAKVTEVASELAPETAPVGDAGGKSMSRQSVNDWVVRRLPAPPEVASLGVVWLKSAAGEVYPAQVGTAWLSDQENTSAAARWVTWIAPRDAAGPWTIATVEAPQPPGQILEWVEAEALQKTTRAGDVGIELRLNQRPVVRLMADNYDDSSAEARDETYKVFHQVWMPSVEGPITKGAGGLFPHHRGLFVGWNRIGLTQDQVTAEVDTWHAKKAHQELVSEQVREAGPVYARQVLVVNWINETIQPPAPFIRETRELLIFPIGDQRLLQFSTRLESLAGEITLAGDPQHAGFQFRAAQHVADISKDQTYYLRPDGIDRPGSFRNWPDNQSHVNLPFHAMSFVVEGKRFTCTRLEHPDNPGEARFSERDYGRFGSYFEHRLLPQQPLQVQYQLRIVPDETDLKTLETWYQDFATPAPQQWGSAQEESFPLGVEQILRSIHPLSEEPVFRGEPQAWDEAIRERGWILHDEGQFKLWYTGYDGQRTSIKRVGLAISTDGLTWQRSSKAPLIPDQWVEDVMVTRHQGIYWMFAEGQNDIAHGFCSADGVTWKQLGALDIRQTDGQPIASGPRGTPTLFIDGNDWYLFYERRDAGIWLAKAQWDPDQSNTDESNSFQSETVDINQPRSLPLWQNVQDQPIIGLQDRDYDQSMIAVNQVVPVANGFVALFHSSSDHAAPRRWVCSAAFSRDLLHWVKLEQPLTNVEQNLSSGIMVASPLGWRFFTTHDQVRVFGLKEAIQ